MTRIFCDGEDRGGGAGIGHSSKLMFIMPYYALMRKKDACNDCSEDTAKSKARLCEKR